MISAPKPWEKLYGFKRKKKSEDWIYTPSVFIPRAYPLIICRNRKERYLVSQRLHARFNRLMQPKPEVMQRANLIVVILGILFSSVLKDYAGLIFICLIPFIFWDNRPRSRRMDFHNRIIRKYCQRIEK